VLVVKKSSESWDVWQVGTSRGGATRMTSEMSRNFSPIWSPDGSRFVFASISGGNRNVYARDASGVGSEELFVRLDGLFNDPTDWSRDGSALVLRRLDPATREDIWILRVAGDRKPAPFLRTKSNEQDGRLSPDGRWIAYRSDESGRFEVYVAPFPTGGARVSVSTDGAGEFRGSQNTLVWTSDGRELIFLGGDGVTVMAAPFHAAATFEAGTPRALFKLPAGTVGGIPSPDGSRYLACVTVPGTVDSTPRAILGWTAELSKK
jgi:Tol biopolymer transport system component